MNDLGSGTRYDICGFRSLLRFSLVLQPGINVFVGPNGSGKTNFIEFLDFLDSTIRTNASAAVSRVGGVARVFSHENAKRVAPVLRAKICGTADLHEAPRFSEEEPLHLFKFSYDIEITFRRRESVIYISKEEIRFYKLHDENRQFANSFVGALSAQRKSAADDLPPKLTIGARLHSENRLNPLQVRPKLLTSRERQAPLETRLDATALGPDESVLGIRRFPALDAVRAAITRGRSVNISPVQARTPDDITAPPGVMRDGSGLTSTLHYLQRLKSAPRSGSLLRLRDATPETIDAIVQWTKLVLPELSGILISADPHTGKFLGFLLLDSSDRVRIPFQSASDGTLKWLSLITMVMSSGGVYTIEEPENFLHPKMQQLLVQLFRDSLEQMREGSYFIFSTHSETLVNQCRPEELLLFRFGEAGTTSHRAKNPGRIKDEINRTGFGLGYYFANNAIS